MYNENHQDLQLGTALSLIHPIFHERNTGESLSDLRGAREFRNPHKMNECQIGTLIEGVICKGSITVADHTWPHSLGGPTNPQNMCELCRKCNGQKSDSIALYNWSLKVEQIIWLVDMLEFLSEQKTIVT